MNGLCLWTATDNHCSVKRHYHTACLYSNFKLPEEINKPFWQALTSYSLTNAFNHTTGT